LKYEKSNLIHIQTKDNLVILTHKIYTLTALTTFLKKCEKCKWCLHIRTKGVISFTKIHLLIVDGEIVKFDEIQ